MFEFQEIIDTSPLGIKRLNDQLRELWNKAKNVTSKDIRSGAVTEDKLEQTIVDTIAQIPSIGPEIDAIVLELNNKLNSIDWNTDFITLNTTISDLDSVVATKVAQFDFNSYVIATDLLVASKVSGEDFGTYVAQTATEISSMVLDSEFTSYQVQTSGLIAAKVSQAGYDSYVTQTAALIGSKVVSADFESYKTQTALAISAKVSNTDFATYQSQTVDAIASKVTSAAYDSYVLQTATLIGSKVATTDYESYQTQTAEAISSKVSNLAYDTYVSQTANSIALKASQTSLSITNGNVTTAQTQANLGVTNAGLAQTKANQGVADALAAHNLADTGIANALAAQTAANLGVTNAATAQTKANQGVADALAAHALADTGIANAATAQTKATTVTQAVTDMSNDNILTPIEKSQLKKEWAVMVAEKPTYDALAITFAITTEKTNYGTAYTNLNTPLNNITNGYLLTMLTNTTIVGTTFRALFDDYYDKKALLIKKINETGKVRADLGVSNAATAQTQANAGVTNAATAQTKANQGVADALAAHGLADTGVANAATAQTQANLGVTNAATANSTANALRDTTVPALTKRVTTAESKITDTAIVNTVTLSTTYVNAMGTKITSAQGTVISQTASNILIGFNGISTTVDISATGLVITGTGSSITAAVIKGGTLTLGGASNVSGLLSIRNATGVEQVKGDNTGIIAKNGASFRVDEYGKGVESLVVTKNNMVNDHSFEMLQTTGSINVTHFDFAVNMPTIAEGNYYEWRRNGSPRLISNLNTDFIANYTLYGLQALVTNLTNYTIQYILALPNTQYTLSGFVYPHPTRNAAGVAVSSNLYVEYRNASFAGLGSASNGKVLTSSHVYGEVNGISRHSFTFTTPANTAMIGIICYGSSTPWTVWDGIELIEGAYPSAYNPENQLWALCRNVSGGPKLINPEIIGPIVSSSTTFDIGMSVIRVGAGAQTIDATGTAMRLRASGTDYFSINPGVAMTMFMTGYARHVFNANGTKTGGSIEIDGEVLGMSPVDSPRVMITDVISNIVATLEGTVVYLDSKLSKALSGYTVFHNGSNIVIESKTSVSFVVKGEGVVDCMIIGTRKGQEDVYWMEMPKEED